MPKSLHVSAKGGFEKLPWSALVTLFTEANFGPPTEVHSSLINPALPQLIYTWLCSLLQKKNCSIEFEIWRWLKSVCAHENATVFKSREIKARRYENCLVLFSLVCTIIEGKHGKQFGSAVQTFAQSVFTQYIRDKWKYKSLCCNAILQLWMNRRPIWSSASHSLIKRTALQHRWGEKRVAL